jgi:hypothetical protein
MKLTTTEIHKLPIEKVSDKGANRSWDSSKSGTTQTAEVESNRKAKTSVEVNGISTDHKIGSAKDGTSLSNDKIAAGAYGSKEHLVPRAESSDTCELRRIDEELASERAARRAQIMASAGRPRAEGVSSSRLREKTVSIAEILKTLPPADSNIPKIAPAVTRFPPLESFLPRDKRKL